MNKKIMTMTDVKNQDTQVNLATKVVNGKSKFIRFRNCRIKNRRRVPSDNSENRPINQYPGMLNIP